MSENNGVCKQHSGFESRIHTLEDNVEKLWTKWDSVQKLLIGILTGVILNLVGLLGVILYRAS